WFPAYLRRRRSSFNGTRHLLLCICDHFEPRHDADKAEALRRVQAWRKTYPAFAEPFRDSEGRHPSHTFFFPIEQYEADVVEPIADLCRVSGCEVEVHLHHDHDTA